MRKNQKGFTLIELLTVVTVIVGLAAIAVPQYTSYRTKAEQARLVSFAGSLYRAFVIYYLEDPDNVAGYPFASSAPQFSTTTFFPLTNRGDSLDYLDFDLPNLTEQLLNDKADAYDSPDDPVVNGEFYLIMTMKKAPNTRIIVSQTDEIPGYVGQWLDGVFVERDGALIY